MRRYRRRRLLRSRRLRKSRPVRIVLSRGGYRK